jgi:general stress protein 26
LLRTKQKSSKVENVEKNKRVNLKIKGIDR